MKNTMKTLLVLLQAILISLLTACGSMPSTPEPQFELDNPFLSDSGGQSSDSEEKISNSGGQIQSITIPSSPRVAPSDILDQVVFEGTGGEGGERWCPCIYANGNSLFLEGFESNQRLRLVAYDEYILGEGDYYADWFVTTNSSGYLELSLSGNNFSDITFFAFDPRTGERVGPVNRKIRQREETTQSSSSDSSAIYAKISSEVVEVNLRSTPGYSNKNDAYDVIVKVPSGEIVEVLDGPSKADGLSWWFVAWNGETGWMADHTGSGRAILLVIP